MPSSTSNSKARTPSLPYAREAAWAALLLAMLGAALMAVSAYLDPSDLRLSPWRAKVDRRAYIAHDVLLWSAAKLRQLPPETFARVRYAIVGDSRCRQLSTSGSADDSDRVVEIAGAPVLNLAFGGASIGDSVDMFARFAGELGGLRAIILCSPIDKFGNFRSPGRVDDVLDQAARPWRYLLNLNTIIAFFEPAGLKVGVLTRRLPMTSASWQQMVQRYRHSVERLRRRQVDQQLRASFDRLRRIAGAGVQLIFYMPPMAAVIEAAYLERDDLYRHIREQLGKRGIVYDYALYDGADSTFELANPAHLLNGSRPILEDILATYEGRREVSRFAARGASPLQAGGR